MIKNKFAAGCLLIFSIALLYNNGVFAQEKKVATTPKELQKEIAQQDSILFHYFNTQNFESFKAMFTKDLEWFQDNDGLICL